VTRYAARIDSNQAEIMDALRKCGVWCKDMHWCGRGVLDILAWDSGGAFWVECKTGNEKLTEAEQRFVDSYPGEWYIARSVEDVVELVNRRRQR
jgi:hypothetical protein